MTHSQILWQLLTGLTVIVTVIATHLRARKDRAGKQTEVTSKIDDVQTTVNGATEGLNARIAQLEAALTGSGVAIPASPGGGVPPTPNLGVT